MPSGTQIITLKNIMFLADKEIMISICFIFQWGDMCPMQQLSFEKYDSFVAHQTVSKLSRISSSHFILWSEYDLIRWVKFQTKLATQTNITWMDIIWAF